MLQLVGMLASIPDDLSVTWIPHPEGEKSLPLVGHQLPHTHHDTSTPT